ncbi:MAG: Vacuolar sorting-associated [Trebouxia sp. A1-2]|nr:MAG: Vacuolar sorting-associated [Trebouxia sp. A1-2]
MGWEPLLEPWTSSLAFSIPFTRQGGREDSQLVAQQLSATLKTQDILELTFTQAVVSCYQAAQGVLNDVALVAAEPTTLEDVILSDDGDLSPGGEALYWLQNLTDTPLQFWSSGPGQSKRTLPFAFEPSDLGEGCLVSPGESHSVIPFDVDMIICKGHHVADPQVFLASASTGDAQAASSSADDAASFPTLEEARSHRQAGLKVLVRLQGQDASDQPLGPWALDMEQKSLKEVQLCAPAAQSAPQSFKVYCQVTRGVRGGAGLTIHSGIRLHNNCGVLLSIGMQQRWPDGVSQEGESARTTKLVAAGDSIWLPALCCKASYLSLQPAGDLCDADETHHWCAGVPLLQLLHQAEYASPASHCQNLVCSPVDNRFYAAHFCLGAAAVPHSQGESLVTLHFVILHYAGYTLVVKAPIELYNALPMPLTVALSSTDPDRSSLPERMLVQPLQSLLLHQMGAFHHLDKVALEPSGYCLSSAMGLPHGPSPRSGSDYFGLEVIGKASVQVHKHRREDGSASLLLCHCYDPASGAHALRVSCSLWVFNCTGLPIALRQSWLLETFASQELLRGDAQVDAVPTAWVPPYRGSSQHPLPVPSITRHKRSSDPYHTPAQSSQSSSMAGRMSSRFNLSGLGEVLTPASVHSQWGAIQQSSIGSNPKGLSDTGQVAVMHQTPTRYASMQGDVEAHRQKVRLQLCATTATSHSGKAFWSDSVQLDALGGAAVVEAPCPMTGGTPSQKEAQAGYRLAVTAIQIPDGDGALALHVMPRYMLHNNLQAGVQYKQQARILFRQLLGQSVERDLLAGGARAMHWPDVTKPKLRLCLRLHEAGWLWSGGFALDTPGDLFVKIRHREQEVTRLVRVDVSTSANGVLAVALSEQEKGFAPYRLDNCTGLKLHLRQKGCIEQDDLLRPYSSLDYAWDEPALPHQLVLELPGNRRLGTYDLDRVGSHYIVTLAATAHRAEQRIQVHVQPTTAQQELVRSQLGWEPWSGTLYPGPASRAASCGPALAGVSLEIQVQVGGLGVSVVGDGEELLYGRISGIQLRAVTGVARQTLELAVQQVQVDNPLQNAAYPITLTSPNTQSSYGVVATAVAAAATAAIPKPAALCLRWSVWRTRPGHVLCVERLEMQTAPLLLEVEQAHAMQLMQFGKSLLAPLADASHAVRQRTPHEPDLMVLRAGGRQRVGGDKVYIEYMHVNKLQITLSFLPSPGVSRGYQWFISVAGEVEGGYLGLAPLQLHHPLLGRQALVQLVHSHYMRAALPGLINMLGSSNVLGSPLSVIHHLQLGVWSFLASPAQGLKESTQGGGLNLPRLVDGFVEGSRSLASNVVLAVSTATAKTTNAARKGLINLGLDKLEATAVPLRQRLQLAGSSSAASSSGPGFLPAVAEGLTGFVREPVRGVRQHGLAGLPVGVMRGSLGLFGHPLGSLLGTAASLSNSIRNSLLGVAMLPPRLRPPRHVSAREPLSLYKYVNALGRALLRTIEGGKYLNEGFIACHQLSVSTGFVIITRVHVLAVSLPHLATSHWTPALTWAAALGDLEHCSVSSNCQQELLFLVMQPELNLLQSQQLLAQKTLGLRLSARLPWRAYTATFESASDAAETLRLVHQGREQVCMYGLLPVQRGGVLGGRWWQGTMLHEKSVQQAMAMHATLRHDTIVQQIHAVTC